MTVGELKEKLKGIPSDAEVRLIDAKDFHDIEYDIDGVCSYPLDVPSKERDIVEIIFNEGVKS